MKKCTKCKVLQPHTEFGLDRRRRDGLQSNCYSCHRKHDRKRGHGKRLQAKYGFSEYQFQYLVKKQGQRCKICDRLEALCVDHDHATEDTVLLIRALLCHRCNRGLGQFGDNANLLYLAFKFILSHQPPQDYQI